MERMHLLPVLLLLYLMQLSTVLPSAFDLPDRFFINCGSDCSATLNGRHFVGDKNSSLFSVSVGQSKVAQDNNPQTETCSVHQTARVYEQSSSFDLDITDKGLYVVRLHFSAFMWKSTNLADAIFNVSALNLSLLSDFSVGNSSNGTLIMEFLLPIKKGEFKIYFVPSEKSFAFVNAIEVYHVPDDYLIDSVLLVSSAGSNGKNYTGLLSQALKKIHRIYMGDISPAVEMTTAAATDWLPDKDYIPRNTSLGQQKFDINIKLTYDDGVPPEIHQNIVPDAVYQSCRYLDAENLTLKSEVPNITWIFNVSKNARHLVRAHFCDILGTSVNTIDVNFYIFKEFNKTIQVETSYTNPAPFRHDFVVESPNSGLLSVSIAPMEDSYVKKAYLNGLEIMEIVDERAIVHVQGESKKKTPFIIIGSVSGVSLIFIWVAAFLWGMKRRKKKPVETGFSNYMIPFVGGSPYNGASSKPSNNSRFPNLNLKLKMAFYEILEATNNFDPKLLIGEGGFGKVYKGALRDGQKVAVKRSESKHGQGLPEFQTEVIVLSKIRHRHLVSLIGYCDEGSEMVLVYEFMEKGTLREHLYNKNENSSERSAAKSSLTWRQRLEICIGSAKGLHYLHTGSDGGIIHRDVKSTNILLNEDYVAKVADFGLSRSGVLNPDDMSMAVKGSFGYLDPEYFSTLQLTYKSDVYSFGVVLLEVLCARPAIVASARREEINLADWGLFWLRKGEFEKIIDPLLVGNINPNSLRKFGETVDKCLKPNGAERPSMLDICWDLEYALQLQQTPVNREPYEDSAVDASFELSLPAVKRLPSTNFVSESHNDVSMIADDDGSDTTASGVFSQLRIDDAR